MRPRLGIAVDRLAAAFVTLALFALPFWVVGLAAESHVSWFFLAFGLGMLAALPALVRVVRTRQLYCET